MTAPADEIRPRSPWLLVPTGLGIGVAAGFSGMGGGFLLVPVLLTLGFAARRAVATSFVAIFITTLSALTAHVLNGNVGVLLGGLLGAGGLIGGQIGSRLVKKVSTRAFRRIFGVILVGLAIALAFGGVRGLTGGAHAETAAINIHDAISQCFDELPWLLWCLVPIGIIVGVLGSFSGMGGGFLLVPILLGLGLPHRACVGSSALAVLVISVSSLQVHMRERAMHWRTGLFLGLGGLAGGVLGAQLVSSVSRPVFQLIFSVVLLGIAARIGLRVPPKAPAPDGPTAN